MKEEEYKQAARYWEDREADGKKMEKEELLQVVEEYIQKNNTCALATGIGDFVRCTPIEYVYVEGSFYLLSEGGLKFKALEENKNVSLAIFDSFQGFHKLNGLQVMGVVTQVEKLSESHQKVIQARGLNLENMKKRGQALILIEIQPTKMEFIYSDFVKKGYSPRQTIYMG